MIILTKKFQIVYKGTEMIRPLEEINGETYVGEGFSSEEFDIQEDAEKFISDNQLTYTDQLEL